MAIKEVSARSFSYVVGCGGGGGAGGIWQVAPENFLNVRNAGFWHSGRLFVLSQMPSLQNLKEFIWWPPLPLHPFFFGLVPPLKPYFLVLAPPQISPAPLPVKKWKIPKNHKWLHDVF